MVSTLFRDPQARSSALAALRTLQLRAFGSLNHVETLDSASNYYIESVMCALLMNVIVMTSCDVPKGCLCVCTCTFVHGV